MELFAVTSRKNERLKKTSVKPLKFSYTFTIFLIDWVIIDYV